MSLQDKASAALDYFTKDRRADDTKFWKTVNNCPHCITVLCRTAHGGMPPDDHKYEFIIEALSALSDHESKDGARDSIESDFYYSQVNKWYGSALSRACYCDEFKNEFGMPETTDELLAGGQWLEKIEVFDLVVSVLKDIELSELTGDEE